MISLYLEAPFAACRTFTSGWFRPTATFLTPSAAYGLILNVAGIDSRLKEEDDAHKSSIPASLTQPDLPDFKIAIGVPTCELHGPNRGQSIPEELLFPRVHSTFQQLHNYPVGGSGKARAADCHGNKYNITPVRREFLSGLRAVIQLREVTNLRHEFRKEFVANSTMAVTVSPLSATTHFFPTDLN